MLKEHITFSENLMQLEGIIMTNTWSKKSKTVYTAGVTFRRRTMSNPKFCVLYSGPKVAYGSIISLNRYRKIVPLYGRAPIF